MSEARVDPLAAAGFGGDDQAERYDRARPSYPPGALDLLVSELGVGPRCRVLDLAAGTGKLTVQLAELGAEVVAVEPLAAMRDRLAARLPSVTVLDGTAEAIPLPDGSVDAVVVAQAFHWFDAPRALAEIARVLRPGGGFALLWNERDDEVPWVAEVSRAMHWRVAELPFDLARPWASIVAESAAFTPLRQREVRFEQEVDAALLVDRAASSSYIAAMGPDEQAALLDEVRAVVAGFPEPFPLPYVCTVHWCHRSSRSPS